MLLSMHKICTGPLSVLDQYSKLCPISSSFKYNGSLVTWTVVCLTATKFKHFILSMSVSAFVQCCTAVICCVLLYALPIKKNIYQESALGRPCLSSPCLAVCRYNTLLPPQGCSSQMAYRCITVPSFLRVLLMTPLCHMVFPSVTTLQQLQLLPP